MTLARRRPLAEPLAQAARALKQCESKIALLDRVRPRNFVEQRARLLAAVRAGTRCDYQPRYSEPAALAEVRSSLDAVQRHLDASDVESALLAERARELALEAELAEHVGAASFADLAARRFPLPEAHAALLQIARAWLLDAEPPASETLHESDDECDPHSLLSLISARIHAERLPIRLEVDPQLVPLAAVADGIVRVRAGARLTAAVSQRIALHEVEGHVLPRLHGQALGGVFLAGSAGSSEDEEGRAILLEDRAGLLDAPRRRELGQRYVAAASARQGAALWDTLQLLLEQDAGDERAVELACRVHRGGGLGRELVYLAGYERVHAALDTEPQLEVLQCSGRVSLAAARRLGATVHIQ